MSEIILFFIVFGIGLAIIELTHNLKPSSPLFIKPSDWSFSKNNSKINLLIHLDIINPHPRIEIMFPEFNVKPVLLGKKDLSHIKITTQVTPIHPGEESRKDNYWTAYIIKSKESAKVEVKIQLDECNSNNNNCSLESIWLDLDWVSYGPFGRLSCKDGFVIPLTKPIPLKKGEEKFINNEGFKLLPIKTHILGSLDDPLEVFKQYTSNVIKPGDVLTIGETPLAIMQKRYLHPSTVNPTYLALILCKAFHPTSSLATACGLQSLINLVGPTRVILAWISGVILKIFGIKGGFYRVAGKQARLIDDITGTTPPYDQMIVLGPVAAEEICKQASESLGVDFAIVDVNDLGRVKILATSRNCNKPLLERALKKNPAGNANEITPLVIVRSCEKH